MNVDGDWELTINSPMGKQHVLVTLHESDGRLTGKMLNKGNRMSTDIFDGAVDAGTLTWKARMQMMNLTLTFTTSVDGDTMTGKVKAGVLGRVDVTGRRAEL
jgi:hypothetical protein